MPNFTRKFVRTRKPNARVRPSAFAKGAGFERIWLADGNGFAEAVSGADARKNNGDFLRNDIGREGVTVGGPLTHSGSSFITGYQSDLGAELLVTESTSFCMWTIFEFSDVSADSREFFLIRKDQNNMPANACFALDYFLDGGSLRVRPLIATNSNDGWTASSDVTVMNAGELKARVPYLICVRWASGFLFEVGIGEVGNGPFLWFTPSFMPTGVMTGRGNAESAMSTHLLGSAYNNQNGPCAPGSGNLYVAGMGRIAPSRAVFEAMAQNPWQLFEPIHRTMRFSVAQQQASITRRSVVRRVQRKVQPQNAVPAAPGVTAAITLASHNLQEAGTNNKKVGPSGIAFAGNGSTNYASRPCIAYATPGFWVAAHIRRVGTPNPTDGIYCIGSNEFAGAIIYLRSAGGGEFQLFARLSSGGAFFTVDTTNCNIPDGGVATIVAACPTSSSSDVYFYVNGVRCATTVTNAGTLGGPPYPLTWETVAAARRDIVFEYGRFEIFGAARGHGITEHRARGYSENFWQVFAPIERRITATLSSITGPVVRRSVVRRVPRTRQPQTISHRSNPASKGLVALYNGATGFDEVGCRRIRAYNFGTSSLLGPQETRILSTNGLQYRIGSEGDSPGWGKPGESESLGRLTPIQSLTFIALNYFDSSDVYATSMHTGFSAVGYNLGFRYSTANPYHYVRTTGGTFAVESVTPSPKDKWHTQALVFDRQTNQLRGYSDGDLFQTVATSGDIDYVTGQSAFEGFRLYKPTAMFAVFDRALSDVEMKRINDNPWQLFTPIKRTITAATTVVSITRPSSDVTVSGWTTTEPTYYGALNELVFDDLSYISSPNIQGTTVYQLVVGISPSLSVGNYDVSIRLRSNSTTKARILLLSAEDTVVGTSEWQNATGTYSTYILPVTATSTATKLKIEVCNV